MTEHLKSHNPATGAVLWEGETASPEAVNAAIARAKAAFSAWSRLSFAERQGYVEKYRAVCEAKKAAFAELISQETGKALWDSTGEIAALLGKVAISIAAYQERTGGKSSDNGGIRQELHHKPHGVMAVFGPYNFPAHLPNGHIVPALLAGNTVVFKPSEETPAVGEFMVSCWREAGLPEGVLNLVQGARAVGEALVAHRDVNGILFTGSYPTGKAIHTALAGRVEMLLALELGGNNPLICWQPADVEAAASLIVQSAYITTGQRCTCARRLIIPQGAQGDALLGELQLLIARLTVGSYADQPEPFMGPLINNRQAENILAAQKALEAMGGKIIEKTVRLQENLPFITPGLMDVTAISALADTEYFGPFLQVIRVADFKTALDAANDTRYGLAAGLIADSPELWEEFRRGIHAGIVNWNRPTTGASSAAPFGGVGLSGNHRPSAYYAADYAAWPVATMASEALSAGEIKGLKNV